MEAESKRHRVILFPFMAQGHMTPFLLLADVIQSKNPNYTITLVNTPLNIQNLNNNKSLNSAINLMSIPFEPSSHGLPPHAENTAALPVHLFPDLFRASETLEPAFGALIASIAEEDGVPPLCIIADHFFAWTVDVARRFGVFHAIFCTSGAYGNSIFTSLWWHLPHRRHTTTTTTSSSSSSNIDDEYFSLPSFPEIHVHRSQLTKLLSDADGTDKFSVFIRRQIGHSIKTDAVLINTAEELEPVGLSMAHKLFQVPVWPIGPLLRLSDSTATSTSSMNPPPGLVQWMNSQQPASVVYVSFGSQNTIHASQMRELAKALEASRRPFIWVVRPPVGFDGEFNPEYWLPQGFEGRMSNTGQGLVVHQWAPQVEILSHTCTGAFLSHCGWNSVLESLIHGVPIIGWPLSADQFFNSKFLVEGLGVCVEAARGNNGSSSQGVMMMIERAIEAVMDNEEMRRKAREISQVLRSALRDDEDEDGHHRVVGSSVRWLRHFFHAAELTRSLDGRSR